ncbi:unnamed protein product [Parascedosporium putredinis]|uniref:Uncharacterized protein n=1 Tax=Parascedosporium putredinis TaxID=1442378 RepID=A0A9P1H7F6_9PEZI|nr:unnamed protein product [Parascedosporium putredinis]CAI7999799.1 unnamed protein product [Parascedosporium putredinis]
MSSNLSPGATRRVTIDSLLLQFLDAHVINPHAAVSYYTNPNNIPKPHNPPNSYPHYGSASTDSSSGLLPAVRPPLATADVNRPVITPSASTAPASERKRKGGPSTPEESEAASKKARKSAFSATGPFYLDVSSVSLQGEASHSVPVYDMCDTVRIRDNKEKDKDRLAVEKQWPGGVDTVRDCTYVWSRADAVHIGKYGGVHSVHYGRVTLTVTGPRARQPATRLWSKINLFSFISRPYQFESFRRPKPHRMSWRQ